MSNINVVVTHHEVQPADLRAIEAVGPGILARASLFMNSATEALIKSSDHIKSTLSDGRDFNAAVRDADVLFCVHLPSNILSLAPRLKWVHVYGAGVDAVPVAALLEKGVRVTNSAGLNAPYIAEFVMGYLLMHVKHMVKRVEWQKARRWQRAMNDTLEGKTLGIVGPGHIGMEVARRAAGFGMTVLAARRSYREGERPEHVTEMFPLARLADMLGRCDFVVVSVGYTPETRHLINAQRFAQMKPGAYFVNVSRGAVVEQPALIEALAGGHLAGAGLDVFDPEPLPADSPLWTMPNVLVTAHSSGNFMHHAAKANVLFCDNLRRFLGGAPMLNLASI